MEALTESEKQRLHAATTSHTLCLRDGTNVPCLGQGTWHMGERPEKVAQESATLRLGVELGQTLIDTAEMYGEGGAERVVGKAVAGIRESVFLVSKVYPYNAAMPNLQKHCEESLRRLHTDYLDLYLLHWRGNIPLAETVEGMERLVEQGRILRWGVSNFDRKDMEELFSVPGGEHCAANQVLYHLGSRGVEYSLLPWMRRNGVALMAYCPLAQAGRLREDLAGHPAVEKIAAAYGVRPLQVVLAWCLRMGALAIPKASQEAHAVQNAQAGALALTDGEMAELSAAFPAPSREFPLDLQ